MQQSIATVYSGKVWQGESLANLANHQSLIRQTKTIQISTYNYNLWLNLSFAKLSSPNARNE